MGKIKEILKEKGYSEDEIEDMFRDLEKQELRRARLSMLREYRLESEARARELENKLMNMPSPGQSQNVSPLEVEAAKHIANLPEDQKNKVLAVLGILKSAGYRDQSVLPLVLTATLANPQAPPQNTAQIVLETISKVKEIMPQQQPQGGLNEMAQALATMAQILKGGEKKEGGVESKAMERLVDVAFQALMSKPKSYLEEILEDPEKLEKVRRLFGGGGSTIDELRLLHEIKKSDREFQLQLKKLELEHKRELMRLRQEESKRKMMAEAFRRLARAATEALPSAEGGEEQQPSQVQKYAPAQKPNVLKVVCEDCGTPIIMPPDVDKIKCPKCGAEYERGVGKAGKTEEGTS